MAASFQEPPGINQAMGPLFMASVITMGLWGANSVQLHLYLNKYTRDSLQTKAQVLGTWGMNTAHTALTLAATYTYLVSNYGDTEFIKTIDHLLVVNFLLSAVICLQAQGLLLFRIWHMSKHSLGLLIPPVVLALAQFGITIAFFARATHVSFLSSLLALPSSSSSVATAGAILRVLFAVSAASALIFSGILAFLVRNARAARSTAPGARGKSASPGLGSAVDSIVAYVLDAGMLVAVCALGALVTGFASPSTLVYLFFMLCFSQVYTVSTFALLNARPAARFHESPSAAKAVGLQSFSLARLQAGAGPGSGSDGTDGFGGRSRHDTHRRVVTPVQMNIRVNTETVNDVDFGISPKSDALSDISAINDEKVGSYAV